MQRQPQKNSKVCHVRDFMNLMHIQLLEVLVGDLVKMMFDCFKAKKSCFLKPLNDGAWCKWKKSKKKKLTTVEVLCLITGRESLHPSTWKVPILMSPSFLTTGSSFIWLLELPFSVQGASLWPLALPTGVYQTWGRNPLTPLGTRHENPAVSGRLVCAPPQF